MFSGVSRLTPLFTTVQVYNKSSFKEIPCLSQSHSLTNNSIILLIPVPPMLRNNNMNIRITRNRQQTRELGRIAIAEPLLHS